MATTLGAPRLNRPPVKAPAPANFAGPPQPPTTGTSVPPRVVPGGRWNPPVRQPGEPPRPPGVPGVNPPPGVNPGGVRPPGEPPRPPVHPPTGNVPGVPTIRPPGEPPLPPRTPNFWGAAMTAPAPASAPAPAPNPAPAPAPVAQAALASVAPSPYQAPTPAPNQAPNQAPAPATTPKIVPTPAPASFSTVPPIPTPANTGGFNIGLVPADEQAKAAAQAQYGMDAAAQIRALQNQAMAYGDPSIMAGLNLGTTVDPNSALALAALRAQQQQLAATGARERAGTLFSSLAQQDRSNIGSAQQRADLAGNTRYQNALANYNLAMTRAQFARDQAIANANLDERQVALNNLPTAQTTAAGGFTGGTTNVRSRVPVGQQKAAKGGKGPTLKPPKSAKGKGKLPTVGGKKGGTPIKTKTVTPVKKVTKVGSRSSKGKTAVPPRLLRAAQK